MDGVVLNSNSVLRRKFSGKNPCLRIAENRCVALNKTKMEIKDISTFLKGPVEKLLGAVGNELKQTFSNRLLEYQVEEYKRNYYSKTLLHRSEPKPLNEFYQPLFISKADSESKKTSTNSAKNLFSKTNYLTIIGSAGSGKSTIV